MAQQAAEEIQDPVAFLTSLRKACPDVISMLNTKQAKLLSKSSKEPYDPKDVNEEYLVDMASFFGVKQRAEDAQQALRNHLLLPNKVKEEVDVQGFTVKLEVLGKVSANVIDHLLKWKWFFLQLADTGHIILCHKTLFWKKTEIILTVTNLKPSLP